MSHVKSTPIRILDLDCLQRAVATIKCLHWREGQKTFAWYGQWMDDFNSEDAAYKLGIDVADYGHCVHAIRVDGSGYEIGVMPRKDGQGYSIVWDFYGTGKNINKVIGDDGQRLIAEYNREFCRTHAKENGMSFDQTETDEYIDIEITTSQFSTPQT